MAIFHSDGFDRYTPESEEAQAAWAGKDLMKPNSKTPYSFMWDDGVSISGEFRNEHYIVRFHTPGHQCVEMLFSEPPVFVSTRG